MTVIKVNFSLGVSIHAVMELLTIESGAKWWCLMITCFQVCCLAGARKTLASSAMTLRISLRNYYMRSCVLKNLMRSCDSVWHVPVD